MRPDKPFTFISTFAGIGGFDLGFERAGMTCEAQVEKDPSCLRLLEKRFPSVKRFSDIKEFSKYGEAVNLISGGFPCQDLSVAGRRAGLSGSRSGLYFQFERVVKEHLPPWFIIENVPGLLSSHKGRDFEIILEGMVRLGYRVAWRIFDSQYFGIPQRRKRVFIVGSLGDGRSASVLFEPESLQRDPSPSEEAREEDSAGSRGSSSGGDQEARVYNWGGVHSDDLKDKAATLRSETEKNYQAGALASESGAQQQNYLYVMASGQAGAETTTDISPTLSLLHEVPIVIWKERFGKNGGGKGYLEGKNLAFAITNKDTQRVGPRRFTPLECERLQGFPDEWTEGFSDTVRYRMTGNAVSVPVAEWIGRRIIKIENGEELL